MAKNNIDNLIVIGDRVLIEPSMATKKTKGGLLLPAGYQEKEEVQSGYILKCGPGYPLPSSEGEDWNPADKEPRYLPLQVKPGDLAIYMEKEGQRVVEPGTYRIYAGGSCLDERVSAEIDLYGGSRFGT